MLELGVRSLNGSVLFVSFMPYCPTCLLCMQDSTEPGLNSGEGGGGMGNSYLVSHFPLSNIVLLSQMQRMGRIPDFAPDKCASDGDFRLHSQ